ncbi:MAG: cyclic nucleotide-binding domain-containing protein [Thermoanaerobaculia bacterium]|nr:cyclic nucleotide-binding domain-containing protein [Thermoanaerobaculia bacterium]
MSESSSKAGAQHLVEVPAGEYVFREGDLGTEMFIVHRGRVEILKRVGEAGGETQLAVFEQGDFFGELSLLDDHPRSASVRALEDTLLIPVSGASFIQMLSENPEIAVRMMRKLSRRLRHTDRLLQQALDERPEKLPPPAAPPPASPAARPTPARATRLVLVHGASGEEFELAPGPETTIGRGDPVTGIEPDIDLTAIDTQRSSSRRHAKLLRRGDRHFLVEEIGTMNGTFVNGRRLDTGKPVEIEAGDKLRFGVLELALEER